MNDLKAYTHVAEELDAETRASYALYAYDVDGNRTPVDDTELVYIKSEADKVIAELKKERDWLAKDRAQAYYDLEKRAQLNIKQEESIRNHKYKRCLAMAEMCNARYDEEDAKVNGCGASWEYISNKMKYWERWCNKWLAIAEKFKPNNSTAQ